MTWKETVRTAFEAIVGHRMRSVLTMLGIVIGIAAVILTVGLGQGAQDKVKDEISALGSNLLIVSPGSTTSSGGVRGGFGSATTLTLGDAQAMADATAVPDAAQVAPVTLMSLALSVGETNWTSTAVGTTAAWLPVRSREVSSGRFFTSAEVEAGANVVVLGSDAAAELFAGPISPVGQSVEIAQRSFTVIGLLDSIGASASGTSEDDIAVLPISAHKRLTGSTDSSVSTIYVEASSDQTLGAAYQEINALLLTRHGVDAGSADFSISSQAALVTTANSTNKTMTILLAGVAAISLLVGGIGVMNIMLVSVTERIREIGLRKALGATPRVIRRQFIAEASILGLLGGVLGVAIGYLIALALPNWIDQPVSISGLATAVALGTSLALGVGFGVYPASRAARLTPIDALRSE